MKIGVFTEGNWFGKVIGNLDKSLERKIKSLLKNLLNMMLWELLKPNVKLQQLCKKAHIGIFKTIL